MSDIETNLNKILTSVYGRDVRQAIHDSIEDCYADGKAGATDLVARNRISQIVDAESGSREETTLYSGNVYLANTTVLFNEPYDLSGFDYLEFHYGITENDNFSIKRVPAVQKKYTFNFFDIIDSDTKGVNAYEMTIDVNLSSVTIESNFVWSWDGSSASNAAKADASVSDETHFSIVKIVGVGFFADAEVADIRVPADGMSTPDPTQDNPSGGYMSAGDAVRGQISELRSQIVNNYMYVDGDTLYISTSVLDGSEVEY